LIIGYDVAQKQGKHSIKHNDLIKLGHDLIKLPIPVGDYIRVTPEIAEVINRRGSRLKKMDLIGLIDLSIDTKQNPGELYSNLVQSHQRFSDECLLAKNNGIKLIVLVENLEGIKDYTEIGKWKNESRWKLYFRAKRKAERMGTKPPRSPAKPSQLKKMMHTMMEKYGVEFRFCHPKDTGKIISKVLYEKAKT